MYGAINLDDDAAARLPPGGLPMTKPPLTSSRTSESGNPHASARPSSLRGLKSNSTSHLPNISPSSTAITQLTHDRSRSDTLEFNTLARTPGPQANGTSTSANDPDLAGEVAALSTKLVNAINHQTTLDDAIQRARHELDAAHERIAQLEATAKQHNDLVVTGALVERAQADSNEQVLRSEIAEERLKRTQAEKEKRNIELELERLTGELFQEANTMVADARKETQQSTQEKEQLRSRLEDTQVLLASQHDQLRELKDVLQQFQAERSEESAQQASAPSTPVTNAANRQLSTQNSGAFGSLHLQKSRSIPQTAYPDHPLSYSHLILPVLRSDLQAYDEFAHLLRSGSKASPSSRANSANFGGLNVMGLGSLTNPVQSKVDKVIHGHNASTNPNSSTSSLSSTPQSIPGAFNSNSPSDITPSFTLKESKYYKRALVEDIEPTLRLDTAPGLSWLARRSLVSSMITGNLIVEPVPASSKQWTGSVIVPCSLCSETREGEAYARSHHFKVNDNDDAQRHALCHFCVGRLRATADFVNFLRMIRSGYWRAESFEDVRLAWEECVRLRERMFWARLGGGVVPASSFEATYGTPRRSHHMQDSSISDNQLQTTPIVQGQPSDLGISEPEPAAEEPAAQSGAVEGINESEPEPGLPPALPQRPSDSGTTDPEKRPKSRGKSVDALRSRFENAAASVKAESPDIRPQSNSRSRTPSPQKLHS